MSPVSPALSFLPYDPQRSYREIVVFLSDEGLDLPIDCAHALTEALGVGRAEIGVDVLTGAAEIRFYYDAQLLLEVYTYLNDNGIVSEIERR